MTLERLKNYNAVKTQKEIFESELDCLPYINAVDTTKPAVMSSKNSDTTADKAIRLAELEEYNRICKEYREISKYLLNIKDQEIKAIAFAYCVGGKSFEEIGKAMHYDKKTVSRKLRKYIVRNVH